MCSDVRYLPHLAGPESAFTVCLYYLGLYRRITTNYNLLTVACYAHGFGCTLVAVPILPGVDQVDDLLHPSLYTNNNQDEVFSSFSLS